MSRFSSRAILFFIVFAVVLMTTPAYSATVTTYNNLSSWQAAVSGVQSINFEGLVQSEPETVLSSPYTNDGVQFIGLSGSTIAAFDTSYYTWSNYGTNDALVAQGSTPALQINLPTGTTAFSLNLFNSNGSSPSSFTATLFSTPYTVPTFNAPTPGFFGVTSDTAISSVTFSLASNGGYYAWFDNVNFGTAQVSGGDGGDGSQTPEAGTFLLIGSGLLALAITRRRKTHQSR